jgi:hypothetical protein
METHHGARSKVTAGVTRLWSAAMTDSATLKMCRGMKSVLHAKYAVHYRFLTNFVDLYPKKQFVVGRRRRHGRVSVQLKQVYGTSKYALDLAYR